MKHLVLLLMAWPLLLVLSGAPAYGYRCTPTAPDADGPFYRPGAPVRNQIGTGYLLMGEVRSAVDCRPIGGARLEIWMTGPDGNYDEDGRYFFVSHFPGRYGSRPPHIHLRAEVPGYQELFTQHYPLPGHGEAIFDLVLIPLP
jgi:protocatechuate 3,4-dioxygenase beta subunit